MTQMLGEFNPEEAADTAHVIYHGNCNDGFGAAFAFHQLAPYQETNTFYEEGVYGKEPAIDGMEDYSKVDLWILDFSYPFQKLIELAQGFNQVIVIDHHKTFIDSIDRMRTGPDLPENLTIITDLARSGAGLTWDYLSQVAKAAVDRIALIDYIEDRDLWKFKLYATKEINAVISATPQTLKKYRSLQHQLVIDRQSIITIGTYLLAQHDKIVDDIVKTAHESIYQMSDGTTYIGLRANCTHHFASDVGNILAQKSGTFGETWYIQADKSIKISIRSIGNFDVSEIAKSFGGGGHKNAAGFVISEPEHLILPMGGM